MIKQSEPKRQKREWVEELCLEIAPREAGVRSGLTSKDSGVKGASRLIAAELGEDSEIIISRINHLEEGYESRALWELTELLLARAYPNDSIKQAEYRKKPDYPEQDFDIFLEELCDSAGVKPPLKISDLIRAQCYYKGIIIANHPWEAPITYAQMNYNSAGKYDYISLSKGNDICKQIEIDTVDQATVKRLAQLKQQRETLESELGGALHAFKQFFKVIPLLGAVKRLKLPIPKMTDTYIWEELQIEPGTSQSYRSGNIPDYQTLTKMIEFFRQEATPFLHAIDASPQASTLPPLLNAQQGQQPWSIDDFLEIGKKIADRFPEHCKKPIKTETTHNKNFREAIISIIEVCNIEHYKFAPVAFASPNAATERLQRKNKHDANLRSRLSGKVAFQDNEKRNILRLLGLDTEDELQQLYEDAVTVIEARHEMYGQHGKEILQEILARANKITDVKSGRISHIAEFGQQLLHQKTYLGHKTIRNAFLDSNRFVRTLGVDDPEAFDQAALFPPIAEAGLNRSDDAANKINHTADWKLKTINPEYSYEFDAMQRYNVVTTEQKPAFERIAKLQYMLSKKIEKGSLTLD